MIHQIVFALFMLASHPIDAKFTWNPVTKDVLGAPCVVKKYRIEVFDSNKVRVMKNEVDAVEATLKTPSLEDGTYDAEVRAVSDQGVESDPAKVQFVHGGAAPPKPEVPGNFQVAK